MRHKRNKFRENGTKVTVGGEIIEYHGNCGTPTANFLTLKLLLNSVISILREKCMMLDIKNFYQNTTMAQYEYIRVKLNSFPENFIK